MSFDYAMILAAGRGERMRPLTDTAPKPMLEVGGKPLIFYHLEKLVKAGVKEVVINHAWLGEVMQRAIGDGSRFHLRIHWSAEPAGGLETAGGIIRALPKLGGQDFIVVNGDVWSDYAYEKLPRLQGGRLGHLVLVDNPAHHSRGDFTLNDGMVKVTHANQTSLTYSGIGVMHTRLFDGLNDDFRKLRPVFDHAIAEQALQGEHYRGVWCDVGTPQRLAQLNAHLQAQGGSKGIKES